MKDFLELAHERFSARKFDGRDIPQEDIEKIIDAGVCAPTAVNNQPVKIWVFRSEEARETLRAARAMARRFDASPDYGIGELRFGRIPEDASVYDALGTTASESMDTLRGLLGDPERDALWKEAEKDD